MPTLIRTRQQKKTSPTPPRGLFLLPLSLPGSLLLVACCFLTFAGCRNSVPSEQTGPPAETESSNAPKAAPTELSPKATEALQQATALLQGQDFAAAATLLETVTESHPDHPRAWRLLGLAHHQNGDFEKALPYHLKAAEFETTRWQGKYQAAAAYARLDNVDKAFELLETVREGGKFNLTGIGLDPDLGTLRDDPRFSALLPQPEDFAEPFVEEVRVLHEWLGESESDAFGWIARNIGDVDGDGLSDVTTSAPGKAAEGPQAGKVYVYSSGSGKLLWSRTGQPGHQLGQGIEAAGDTNGDGIPDVIAGAPGGERAFVYSGRDGALLLTLEGTQEGETFGHKVCDVGDFDGDGHGDVLVGAPLNDQEAEDAGRAAVFSGKDGSVLFEVFGQEAGDRFGNAGAGLSRGGHTWLVVGAPNAGPEDRGRAYVYRDGAPTPHFIIEAEATGARLGGMFVSMVGDVDSDGTPDIYASDWADGSLGPSTGRIYVHSGADGRRLFNLGGEAAGDGFGIGPADAGDVDGDGHDDLIIGAWQHRSAAPSGGKVYLYSGKDGSLLRAITSKVPGETFGFDATGMGDIDGDGRIDYLLTSAWSAIRGARSGRMFIVAG
ncbi:MAG: FG-GAP-like repeat-containing protein [Deltaproteobacteria bacterium]|nr:FG-GAP-like repeat-containing protein [Deltaproteobacteria bacterium]